MKFIDLPVRRRGPDVLFAEPVQGKDVPVIIVSDPSVIIAGYVIAAILRTGLPGTVCKDGIPGRQKPVAPVILIVIPALSGVMGLILPVDAPYIPVVSQVGPVAVMNVHPEKVVVVLIEKHDPDFF